MTEVRLTHVDDTGASRMVDVSGKDVTARSATAAGIVRTTEEVIALLREGGLKKGDAVATARIAGIMGAKRTPDLIPLCHPIALHNATVDIALGTDSIEITATTRTADRTGVEMEALTAVAVAGLTMIDMIKAVDPAASIDEVRVLRKEGGKTGLWERRDADDRLSGKEGGKTGLWERAAAEPPDPASATGGAEPAASHHAASPAARRGIRSEDAGGEGSGA